MTNQTETTKIQIDISEKQLEDFLCSNNNLKKYFDLEFIARQVPIPPAGIIDILAYHRESQCFIIIELKKNYLDLNALAQGMSYLRYYQYIRKYNPLISYNKRRERKFALLLVGQHLDLSLHKIVDYIYRDEYFINNNVYYKLFSMDFETGINFEYYSTKQLEYQECLSLKQDEYEHKASMFLDSKPTGFF